MKRFINHLTLTGAYDVFIGLYLFLIASGLLKLVGLAGVAVGIMCIWVGANER